MGAGEEKRRFEIMKYLSMGFLAVLLLVGVVATASAGDYHRNAQLICSDCHTMHASQSHDYVGTGGTTYPGMANSPIGGAKPYERLLRNTEAQICLGCHNGNPGAPDVIAANTGQNPAVVRQAGALNCDGVACTNDAEYSDTMGHTIGSTSTPPGGVKAGVNFDPALGLSCMNCHSAHGSDYYRNLRIRFLSGQTPNPNWSLITYAIGANDTTKDVFEAISTKGDAAHYAPSNIQLNNSRFATLQSAFGQYCSACHSDFHGTSGDPNMKNGEWLRHPTADAVLSGSMTTRWASFTNRVKVMSGNGAWDATGTNLGPTCLTCHKGHGNKNPFSLVFMGAGATLTEEGAGGTSVRDTCGQCHGQGGLSPTP
jgi:hypothetical protein